MSDSFMIITLPWTLPEVKEGPTHGLGRKLLEPACNVPHIFCFHYLSFHKVSSPETNYKPQTISSKLHPALTKFSQKPPMNDNNMRSEEKMPNRPRTGQCHNNCFCSLVTTSSVAHAEIECVSGRGVINQALHVPAIQVYYGSCDGAVIT